MASAKTITSSLMMTTMMMDRVIKTDLMKKRSLTIANRAAVNKSIEMANKSNIFDYNFHKINDK